jgi:DMSO/TMAO reductase YedYZ molybdopterin-dependent catalytic subunit
MRNHELNGDDPPRFDRASWRLRVWGQVAQEAEWSWASFTSLPTVERVAERLPDSDLRLDGSRWAGVQTRELLSRIRLRPAAAFVMIHALDGSSTGLPLSSFAAADTLFAWRLDGRPLTEKQGRPVRLLFSGADGPRSVKGVHGLEFLNKPWPAAPDAASRG